MSSDEYTVLQGYHMGETGKAIMFEVHQVSGSEIGEPRKEWFPTSQVKAIMKNSVNGSNEFDTITVKSWLVEKKGLE